MKSYELTYLISSELLEEETKTLQEKMNSLIRKEEGILIEKDSSSNPLKTELSYPIAKKNYAYLVSLAFSLAPEKLAIIEKELKAEEQILRYLIITKKQGENVKAPRRSLTKKITPETVEKPSLKKTKKVELKDIEKKLEEILEG